MCDKSGCTRAGTHRPVLTVAALGFPPSTPRARMEVGLMLCAECAATTGPDHFVTDEGWTKIEDGFARLGRAAPDRASLQVEYVSL
jgi:hypothetical protein